MGFHDHSGDGEAKPCATPFAVTARVDPMEALEYVGQVFGWNAWSLVFYPEARLVAVPVAVGQGQRLLQVFAVALIAGIGFSRPYASAHWPSDVLGGYVWGASFLLAASVVLEHVQTAKAAREPGGWRRRRDLSWMAELKEDEGGNRPALEPVVGW